MDEAISRLAAKLVVLETIVRTQVIEALAETDDPIGNLRDYANRVEASLTSATPTGPASIPAMMLQAEIAEQFAVIEKCSGRPWNNNPGRRDLKYRLGYLGDCKSRGWSDCVCGHRKTPRLYCGS